MIDHRRGTCIPGIGVQVHDEDSWIGVLLCAVQTGLEANSRPTCTNPSSSWSPLNFCFRAVHSLFTSFTSSSFLLLTLPSFPARRHASPHKVEGKARRGKVKGKAVLWLATGLAFLDFVL